MNHHTIGNAAALIGIIGSFTLIGLGIIPDYIGAGYALLFAAPHIVK